MSKLDNKKPKDIRRTKAYLQLKASMADSLQSRGLIEPVYTELLSRYLDLWCEYQDLTADIAERGVVVMDEKRGMLVENRTSPSAAWWSWTKSGGCWWKTGA